MTGHTDWSVHATALQMKVLPDNIYLYFLANIYHKNEKNVSFWNGKMSGAGSPAADIHEDISPLWDAGSNIQNTLN